MRHHNRAASPTYRKKLSDFIPVKLVGTKHEQIVNLGLYFCVGHDCGRVGWRRGESDVGAGVKMVDV